uniref:N/A n=1 Tax=Ganoderma boninense TaxID=34458 RepID=A0A5K1K331_9APHY|nr:N/A [Ganoderma boninense]
MASNNWRNSLHTFVDETNQIFTITNVPPIINMSPISDSEFLTNFNSGSVLRPRLSIQSLPELPFVLHRDPVGDPLLSRLFLDPATIVLAHFERGWALPENIRNAWIRLEKGLLYVSELLLTSTERSSCGASARHAIRHHEHWPPPEDFGYRQAHESAHTAKRSILRAHLAFRLLVARCSLAIALWLFPGADEGHGLPRRGITHYDADPDTFVPEWVSFLRRERVPDSWIDALCDSIITDFSINLRVGTIVDPVECGWFAILPVLRAANIPVFVIWRNKSIVQSAASSPLMKSFSPRSLTEVLLALQHPPIGKPRIVTLCRGDETRPLPDYSAFDGSTPPFGPYQRPHELRTEFLRRRERYHVDQARQETQSQMQWRQQRIADADAGLPPFRRSRVYLWVQAQLIYPDLPPQWLKYDYRYPISPSAYRSLWMVHPPHCRQYDPYFDEWDFWFPPEWEQSREEGTDLDPDIVASRSKQRVPQTEGAKNASEKMVAATVWDEQDLLIPTPQDRQIRTIDFLPNDHLQAWYGLSVADMRTYDEVNYSKWAKGLWNHFSQMSSQFPSGEAIQKCIAGWTWAMLEGSWDSPALAFTWDLDKRHPMYLLRAEATDPRNVISMDHHQAPVRQSERDDIARWVSVTFRKDPVTQSWSLFTSAMGALLLVRRIHDAQTSLDALLILIGAGIPCRTGILLPRPPSPIPDMLAPSVRLLRLPYRKRGERPSLTDYDAYCQRVLELSRRPYLRAAWLKGGIVWRILMEVTGSFPSENVTTSLPHEVVQGPSAAVEHYSVITVDREGSSFYDDELSLAELDIISGVVRVYTGIGAQTEDVSWWPKHHAWVKGSSYTGIWTSLDEHWFQQRLKNIYEGEAHPLNSHEWREALRKRKTTRSLATVVEKQSWDFTYRNFALPSLSTS